MRTSSCSLLLLAGLGLAAASPAQRLATYMPGGPGFFEHQPPTAIQPAPVPPLVGYPAVPALPGLAVAAGDSSFDNFTGLHWFTNGFVVATQPTPTFPPAGPVLPPVAIPPAVLAALGGGPVTGLAVDPAAGVLFLAGAPGLVVGVGMVPAMPVVMPPFPLVGFAPPLAGLEWDGATGTLWAVNAAGVAFNHFPGGAPALPPVAPPMLLAGPVGDIAIDKTLRVNGAGLRPLFVVAGPMLLDLRDPVPMPFPAAMPMSQGLAFLDHPAARPPVGSCPCPGTAGPVNFSNGPMVSGNLGWSIGMTGLAPFGIAVFGFDVVFNPAFPLVNGVGCGLGLMVGSPTLVLALALADAAGTAVPGVGPLFNQNATWCPADPTGFVFTPMQLLRVGGL
jgi:hypothetical protein